MAWRRAAPAAAMLAVGCATPSTASSRAGGPSAPPQAERSAPERGAQAPDCSGSPRPAWLTQTGSLEAVGESRESPEEAEAIARTAVMKQVEVHIEAEDQSLIREKGMTGSESVVLVDVQSKIRERINTSVSGMETLKRFTDTCRKTYHALVRLDRVQAAQAWLNDLKTLGLQRQELAQAAAEHQRAGRVLPLLDALQQVLERDLNMAMLERRVAYLAPQLKPADSSAARVVQSEQQLAAVLGSLTLRYEGGNEQEAKPGKPLPKPLAAGLVAALPSGPVALPDIPVRFAFQTGQGDVDPLVRTNQQGRAEAAVRNVAASAAAAQVVAQVAVEQLPAGLSPVLKQRLQAQLAGQEVRFSIKPPPAAPENPMAKALYELAMKLSEQVNTSYGKPAVVHNFVESGSGRRLSLSARIESLLAINLARIGNLDVIEKGSGTREAGGQPGAGPQAAIEVFGSYQASPDGGVWIIAKLHRLTDDRSEGGDEVTVPRVALSDDEVRELRLKPGSAPSPILAPPAPRQSYSEWVEAFWDLRNPSGFKTDLEPLEPQVRKGEKAYFRFRTTVGCYLTVVNIGASGAWTVLLPNQWRPTPTFIQPGQWEIIPGPRDQYDFTVDPDKPVGTERVKAICTTAPVTLIENMDLSQGLFGLSKKDEVRFRDIKPTARLSQPEQWSEAHTQILTLEPDQRETEGQRGLRSRGVDRGRRPSDPVMPGAITGSGAHAPGASDQRP
jgi:hypothetical protein